MDMDDMDDMDDAFAEILEKNGTPLEAARPQKRSPQQIDIDMDDATRPSYEYSLPQENPLDAIEIDQGLNDAAGTSFDFMEFDLDEKARKDPNESSFSGVSL